MSSLSKHRVLLLALAVVLAAATGAIESTRLTSRLNSHALAMPAAVRTVTVITDPAMNAPARHGIDRLEAALRDKSITVSEDQAQLASSDVVVVAGVVSAKGPAATLLTGLSVPAPAGAESLVIRKGARFRGKPAVVLAAGDGTGLMYAALDTADRVAGRRRARTPSST